MKEYYGIIPGQDGRLSKITKWGVALVAVFMGIKGVQAGRWAYVPLALVLIIVAFFRKEQVISERGIDVQRIFVFYRNHSVWPWKEVTKIRADYVTMDPMAVLLVYRGSKRLQIMMQAEDARAVVRMGRRINSSIELEVRDASGEHSSSDERRDEANAAAPDEAAVQTPEDFASVKKEMEWKKQRLEELEQYTQPDPATANVLRPKKPLKDFRPGFMRSKD